ncbi:MAG: putative rane protein [Blastocatellia bacterium]
MQRQAEALKGIAIGALAGLVGGLVMNQFQNLWSKLTEDESDSEHAHPPRQHVSRQQLEGEQQSQEEEPATVKTAEAISREVFNHELTKDERRIAGPVVHYTFSATTGMVYGALAELTPLAAVGFGLPFGAAVWAVADETMVPLFGLSKPPTAYPLSKHLYSLASHLIYGATTEAARRLVRRMI